MNTNKNLINMKLLFTMIIILITRIWVYLFSKPSPTIKNFRTHHWMYGLLFTIILFSISGFYTNIYLLSISMGVFLDEIGFILIRGKTHEDNYNPKSFIVLFIFILLLFIFRETIINLYLQNIKLNLSVNVLKFILK